MLGNPVFPAHAGMFPTVRPVWWSSGSFPRVHGDVPKPLKPIPHPRKFSLRARGCSHPKRLRGHPTHVFPACAGMFLRIETRGARLTCFPRVRGDVPYLGRVNNQTLVFSPRARGCSSYRIVAQLVGPVFPACAGMFLRQGVNAFRSLGFPRVRGDVPLGLRRVQKTPKFSPRARGCSPGRYPNHRGFFVFPAYAGMFLGVEIVVIFLGSFPRVRGDVPCCQVTRVSPLWFSPRARGCSAGWCSRHACRDVFPAHAGMFRGGFGGRVRCCCFPRARGDVPASLAAGDSGNTFSPRARGCSSAVGWWPRRGHRFPRVRGDVPGPRPRGYWYRWFSPRARGCSLLPEIAQIRANVFPTCAGMFPPSPGTLPRRGGFPHVRGDVPASGLSPMVARWFSPRTRGCSVLPPGRAARYPVFPACAGMFLPIKLTRFLSASFPHKHEDLPPLKTGNFSTGEYSPHKREHSGNPP